ncbi:MAG: right-handed parallel beta-helix repeat-containing protein [Actinobacteria bacterium]|nr:right-handed parallel beta-helix repeat-containing protein [Actinomycetota bacterium]
MGNGVGRRGAAVLLGSVVLSACTGGGTIITLPPPTTPDVSVSEGTAPATLVPSPLEGQLRLDRETGVVLDGLIISNPYGDCIRITHSSDVVIRNAVIGPCAGRAIFIQDSSSVVVESSELFDSASGVYALDSTTVIVTGSLISNAGRNPVQYDKVTGVGNKVSGNEIVNEHGAAHTEDSINIYESGGTETSPLTVEDNLVIGGGSSGSGSGILVGDNGGSHQLVRNNTLINPGQVGIGVAGGRNIRVLDNLVFSRSHPWSNVGIYVWDQYETECRAVEVSGNVVQWQDSDGAANALYDAGNCGLVSGWELNEVSSDLEDVLRSIYGEVLD